MKGIRQYVGLFAKGAAMGAANVIPGVSGGTIAFITGIYEELIHSIKSFDLHAIRLLLKGKFRELFAHLNLTFLIPLVLGIGLSILSLAKILEYLFINYPVLTWSFFFGLIFASVYFVGRIVTKWNVGVVLAFLGGTAIALFITFMNPGSENDSMIYMFICGIVAISSMILPGLSGSFVLIIMGNYLLVLGAVGDLDIPLLVPFAVGCVVGLVAFSHLLSWVFRHFKDITIGLLTGFIFGSLSILWPWKTETYLLDALGNQVLRDGKPKVSGYEWNLPELFGGILPENFSGETIFAVLLMAIGIVMIWVMEKYMAAKPLAQKT